MKKWFATAVSLAGMVISAPSSVPAQNASESAFDYEFQSIDGKPMKLSDWRGKVLLVVNTASFCGYTKQYAGLQELWSKYEAEGLVVVGAPSYDFGGQEPKAEGEIKKFCSGAFGVTFPLTAKQVVAGPSAHPFYQWAAKAAGPEGAPQWNFHKYLIGRNGSLLRSISTQVSPDSTEFAGWIDKALFETESQALNSFQKF